MTQVAKASSSDSTSSTNAIVLTDSARHKIRALMKRDGQPDEAALRVAVVGGGCSGFSYKMSFETEPRNGDLDFIENGLRVFVDQKSALFVSGLKIDFEDGLNASGFTYENPKAAKSCGCGTSFAV